MSSTSPHSRGPRHTAEAIVLWAAIIVVCVPTAAVTVAVHIANSGAADPQRLPVNPFTLVGDLASGTVRWPAAATLIVILMLAAGLGVVTLIAGTFARRRSRRHRFDRAARWMASHRDLRPLTAAGAGATAERLGVATPGLPIAKTVVGGKMLYASWEDVQIVIAGPRTSKTTSTAIPSVLAAPGAVVATSNKRDLVDATRGPREHVGRVWVFDPQQLVDEPPAWWWNPLSYVTDDVKAARMAEAFVRANRDPGAHTDAYFDPAGQTLLSNLLLAAALDHRPITQVYVWVTRPNDEEPAQILDQHHYDLQAKAVLADVHAPDKQRQGVFGTARGMCSFLTNRGVMKWATPDGSTRPHLNLSEFVRGRDTLHLLSREGKGSGAPLVTALVLATTEAAEDYAKRCPGGRMTVPLVGVLDEAANVVRIPDLGDRYSHYGSRGICLITILQSWSQGVEVWGRDGMRKLWSAANVKVYGGGVSEGEFLGELSALIGEFDLQTASVTHAPGRSGGRSTTYSVRSEKILDVADLSSQPKGRMVVFASGVRPAIAQGVPWMDGPDAEAVRDSIARYSPSVPEPAAAVPARPAVNPWLPS